MRLPIEQKLQAVLGLAQKTIGIVKDVIFLIVQDSRFLERLHQTRAPPRKQPGEPGAKPLMHVRELSRQIAEDAPTDAVPLMLCVADPAEKATDLGEARTGSGTAEVRAPLAGLRVADFGIGGVGVEVGRMLAEYGAEVLKVESRSYPDFIRLATGSGSFFQSATCSRYLGSIGLTERGAAPSAVRTA